MMTSNRHEQIRAIWHDLTDDDRECLGVICQADEIESHWAARRRHAWLESTENTPPEGGWRWITYSIHTSNESPIDGLPGAYRIRNDLVVHSRLAKLRRLGLVDLREELVDTPSGMATSICFKVKLRPAGKIAVRGPERPLANHSSNEAHNLMSRQLWRALIRVAKAEPRGLPTGLLRPKVYLELNGRRRYHFIDTNSVIPRQRSKAACFFLTAHGRDHISTCHESYQLMYPEVS